MKKKLGFTLAEVLITLAIIGIIAALVLPAVLNNFQFRAVGVRLSKFMSSVENTARAYVETEGALDPGYNTYNLNDFINNSFSVVAITGSEGVSSNRRLVYQMSAANGGNPTNVTPQTTLPEYFTNAITASSITVGTAPVELKDGTRAEFYALPVSDDVWPVGTTIPNQGQIGRPALGIAFDPAANALPSAVRRIFLFVVTELGYVYPAPGDQCTWDLYNARWRTTPDQFENGRSCGIFNSLTGNAPANPSSQN